MALSTYLGSLASLRMTLCLAWLIRCDISPRPQSDKHFLCVGDAGESKKDSPEPPRLSFKPSRLEG